MHGGSGKASARVSTLRSRSAADNKTDACKADIHVRKYRIRHLKIASRLSIADLPPIFARGGWNTASDRVWR
jgi:hypothetical protein